MSRAHTAPAPHPPPQDLRGQWSGGIQAYGGGSGPTSLEFDMRGAGWQWGPHYSLDSLVANGSYHSEEGLQLQEVRAVATTEAIWHS
jgi:hypothetical protein